MSNNIVPPATSAVNSTNVLESQIHSDSNHVLRFNDRLAVAIEHRGIWALTDEVGEVVMWFPQAHSREEAAAEVRSMAFAVPSRRAA